MIQDFYGILAEECGFIKDLFEISDLVNKLLLANEQVDFDGNIVKIKPLCGDECLENFKIALKDIIKKSVISYIKNRDLDELLSRYGVTQKDVIIELIKYD